MGYTISEITDLRIYPIKSCRGISIPSAALTPQGLSLDRRWMFVNSKNKFITIRQKPQMTLINTSIDSSTEELIITVGTNKENSIRVPLHPTDEYLETKCTPTTVDIWENLTSAYAYNSPTIKELFSTHIGEDVKLVMKDPSTKRICLGNGSASELGREADVNFPDVLPVLIASEASISELNARLGQKGHGNITIERFRPNIIIRGGEPWEEDSWKTVRINGDNSWVTTLSGGNKDAIDIDIVARCARCQVPNVDPDTAEKDKKQPWDTLMSYRRVDEGIKWKPCFGMLGCPRGEGHVEVGMRFEVTKETAGHKYITGF